MGQSDRNTVQQWLEEGGLVCACDASVVDNKKVIVLWYGSAKEEKGICVGSSVYGLPQYSVRVEMGAPVIVMEILNEVKKES